MQRLLEQVLASPSEVRAWLPGAWPTLEGTRRKVTCLIHVPTATLLRAQDRNPRTQLRSAERPWGDNVSHTPVWMANNMVRNVLSFIRWAGQRGILVVLANPPDSYLWPLTAETVVDGAPRRISTSASACLGHRPGGPFGSEPLGLSRSLRSAGFATAPKRGGRVATGSMRKVGSPRETAPPRPPRPSPSSSSSASRASWPVGPSHPPAGAALPWRAKGQCTGTWTGVKRLKPERPGTGGRTTSAPRGLATQPRLCL